MKHVSGTSKVLNMLNHALDGAVHECPKRGEE